MEASKLQEQGLTQQEIGVKMGIGQSRVSALLNLNRTLYLSAARYRQTELYRKTHNKYCRKWNSENPEKRKTSARLAHRKYYVVNREQILERAVKKRAKRQWMKKKVKRSEEMSRPAPNLGFFCRRCRAMPVAEQEGEQWYFVTGDHETCERWPNDEPCDTEFFDTYDEAAMAWLTTHGIVDLTPPSRGEIQQAREYVEAHPELVKRLR